MFKTTPHSYLLTKQKALDLLISKLIGRPGTESYPVLFFNTQEQIMLKRNFKFISDFRFVPLPDLTPVS